MRHLLAFLAAIALAAPAPAGLRATYAQDDDSKMIVEIADDGDARITWSDDSSYGLLIRDDFYFVTRQDGDSHAFRLTDFTAALRETGTNLPDMLRAEGEEPMVPSGEFHIEQFDTRTIAGRVGKAYRVYGMPAAEPNLPEIYVISDDPALAPIAKIMRGFMMIMPLLAGEGSDPAYAEMIAGMSRILSLGAPLDTGGHARLEKIEEADFPAAKMRLPGPPLTTAQIVAGLKVLKASPEAVGGR